MGEGSGEQYMLGETANQDLIRCITCVNIIQNRLHKGEGMERHSCNRIMWKKASCMGSCLLSRFGAREGPFQQPGQLHPPCVSVDVGLAPPHHGFHILEGRRSRILSRDSFFLLSWCACNKSERGCDSEEVLHQIRGDSSPWEPGARNEDGEWWRHRCQGSERENPGEHGVVSKEVHIELTGSACF